MFIEDLFKNKTVKAKAKVTQVGEWLLDGTLPTDELLAFAEQQQNADKANCIEAIEYATRKNPKLADEAVFSFVTNTLKDAEPRIKWESARVISNTAHLYPSKLDMAIANLILNAEHPGTVVRWATALALGEILKLKTNHNSTLLKVIENLTAKEEENGVKKKYLDALKKVKK